jgi:hypothetical protein
LSIRVKDTVSHKLKKLEQQSRSTRTMTEVASTVKSLIVQRTLAGRDIYGRPFTAYSTKPAYISIENRPPGYPKPKGGRTSRTGKSMYFEGGYAEYKAGLGRGIRPQLSVSESMLHDIRSRVLSHDRAILFYQGRLSAAKAATHHLGHGDVPARPHFDIGRQRSEIATLERLLIQLYREYASNADLRLA